MADQTFKAYSNASGVTPTNAQDIVKNHDASEVLEYGGVVLQFFVKRITKTKPPVWVLVVAQSLLGKDPGPCMVFKVYETFAPNIDSMQPTDLLRLFAERFGCPIHVGEKTTKKLYLGETVTLTEREAGTQFINPEPPKGYGATAMALIFVKLDPGPPLQAVCALAFSGDLTAYGAYLKRDSGR